MARVVRVATMARTVHQVHQEIVVLLAQAERLVHLVLRVKALRVQVEKVEHQALMAHRVLREKTVHQGNRVHQVQMVRLERVEKLEHLVQMVLTEHQVNQVAQVQAVMEQVVQVEILVRQVRAVQQEQAVQVVLAA
jgi:hypothetical protein